MSEKSDGSGGSSHDVPVVIPKARKRKVPKAPAAPYEGGFRYD